MNEVSADKAAVLEANIAVHTALAGTYDVEQPHYRPENKVAVSGRLARLAEAAGHQTLVDFGCGTGFVIHLAAPYFQTVYGVDVTPGMLSRVDLGSGKVRVLEANTESVPLADSIANVVTANSYLHHLYDIQPTIAEAYRLLRPGGVFFSEEDPNAFFWSSLKRLGLPDHTTRRPFSDVVERELSAVLDTHTLIESAKGVDARLVQLAEYQKMTLGGMGADELETIFRRVGFSQVNIEYYWFLGQAKIMHQSAAAARDVEAYLRLVLPLSQHLFKYLRIEAWK